MDHQHQHQQEEWSSCTGGGGVPVPPGFRFHPTEEELVGYYLARKVLMASSSSSPHPPHNNNSPSPHNNNKQQQIFNLFDDIIQEVDLYRIEPWDLQERCSSKLNIGGGGNADEQQTRRTTTEWYFFSYKDRKYPSGTRSNRATAAGFWKATGRDKPVLSSRSTTIGMRKTLVFYRGRAPNGRKTEWIMHEYRLQSPAPAQEEAGWVVCRAFHKPIPNHHQYQHQTQSYYPYATPTTTTTPLMPPAGYYDYDHHHHHHHHHLLLGSSSALLHHPPAATAAGINISGGGFPQQSSLYDDLQLESKKHHLCFRGILPQLESPTASVCCAADGSVSYPTEQHDEQLLIIQQQQQQQQQEEGQQLPGAGAGAGAIDWSFLDTLLATTSHQLHDYPL